MKKMKKKCLAEYKGQRNMKSSKSTIHQEITGSDKELQLRILQKCIVFWGFFGTKKKVLAIMKLDKTR